VQAFTGPGDNVIVQPPVYGPFFRSVKETGRTVVENPMRLEHGRYVMDFDQLRRVLSSAKLFILCNPHNPGGRAWTREELSTLSSLCEAAGVLVVSDEIHADLVFKPNTLTPFRSVNAKSLTLYAGSKTFNLPGLSTSMAYSEEKEVLDRFTRSLYGTGYHLPSCHGLAGNLAAFAHGAEWLDELLEYLAGNAVYAHEELKKFNIDMPVPESTYLGWMDCGRLNKGAGKELAAFFVEKAGLALNTGADYGTGGENFMRINLACSRSVLRAAMQRLEQALG
jgi:cystathionine beta-lyase